MKYIIHGQAFAGRPENGEDNAEGIDNVNGDNMTVQNNYIHMCEKYYLKRLLNGC